MRRTGAGSPGEQSVVERFLGPDAAGRGLHALLGLSDGDPGEEAVIGALGRCLTRIDQHPQGRTPEADEVRLALHAAAARLLDHAARKSVRGAPVRAPITKTSPQRQALRLEQDAIITLARYGGWNRRSLRRLTMLALARGARPGDVAGVLTHLAGRRRAAPGAVSAARPRSVARSSGGTEKPGSEHRPLVILIGAAATGLALVVAVALVVVAFTTGKPGPDAGEQAEAAARTPVRAEDLPMAGGEELFPWKGGEEGPVAEETGAEPAGQAPSFERLSDALAALDAAADGLEIDPAEAVRVFERAFAGVGAHWCNLSVAQQRAAQHDVVEFVYRAVQRPELTAPAIDAIAGGGGLLARPEWTARPEDLWPAAWSVGMLARLARERDIGAVASGAIEDRLREFVGSSIVVSGGFEQGVQAALWAMLPAMVADRDTPSDEQAGASWERWIDAARFGETDARGTMLAALEWAMVAPDEPSENDAVRVAIESLTLACDWDEGAPGRTWLIRMFGDGRVSDADLHAVTTTLSRRSRAPGVDVTMALPVRATTDAREALRVRYAAVWGIDPDGPSLDDLAADWILAAREASKAAEDDASLVDRLASAVAFSRISEAARLRHDGRLDEAGVVIDEYDRPIEIELTSWSRRRRPDRIDASPGMSRWALSYLSAQRDFTRRLELLGEAAKVDVTHPADAEVLVTEAVRGSPAQARASARAALLTQRPTAALTLAMLEVSPRMPRTPQNAELVAALTATATLSIDDPDWRLRTRRILVQTALEQLAAEGEQGVVDRLAGVLGQSYSARVMGGASGAGSASIPDLTTDQAAAMLRLQWERLARKGGLGSEVLEVESVLAQHASRMGLAEGPAQTFAAEQIAAFELMSIAVASERIDRASVVQALRLRVRSERRDADDIIEQILIVERAFVELWAFRLGQETPWG